GRVMQPGPCPVRHGLTGRHQSNQSRAFGPRRPSAPPSRRQTSDVRRQTSDVKPPHPLCIPPVQAPIMPVPDRPPTGSPVPAAIPHARLSAFYFWYYGLLGLLHPFWPIFLSHQRFSASEIGQLLAIQMATRLLAPNLWGWIADRSGRRMATIRVGAALGMVFFAGIFVADGFWSMALVMAGYSFFW